MVKFHANGSVPSCKDRRQPRERFFACENRRQVVRVHHVAIHLMASTGRAVMINKHRRNRASLRDACPWGEGPVRVGGPLQPHLGPSVWRGSHSWWPWQARENPALRRSFPEKRSGTQPPHRRRRGVDLVPHAAMSRNVTQCRSSRSPQSSCVPAGSPAGLR